jgi:hypothetical protein
MLREHPPGRGVLSGIVVTRGRTKGATNSGQAVAGMVCSVPALLVGIVFAARFGTAVTRPVTGEPMQVWYR